MGRKQSASKRPEPSKPAPLPSSFSKPQAKKAVDALLAHHAKVASEREETELLPRQEHVWLVVNTKRGSTKAKLMPRRIQLPHSPLPPPPTSTVALIVKPPQRQYKDLIASPEHNIKFINRVVDTDKLRGKWKPFEARRELMRENDLWLADERVVPSLPKLLGKVFFSAKKIPIPVNLQRKDLKAELARAINSTYFHPSTGTSHSIRIATPSSTSAPQTLDNLIAALPAVVGMIDDGWENVLSIGIKTSSSILLPVWNSQLSGRFNAKASEQVSASEEEPLQVVEESKMKKGKKRSADESEQETPAEVGETKAGGKRARDSPESEEEEHDVEVSVAPKKMLKSSVGMGPKGSKKEGKKSSLVGSGGAGRKAKQMVLGAA